MKKYLDSIFSRANSLVSEQVATVNHKSQQHGVKTFYNSDKPEKEIIEPRRFIASQFSRYEDSAYGNKPAFCVVKDILANNSVADVIPGLEKSGLRGCGGAHFPVTVKWKAALENPGPRYLIVNGLEGELHTFKDYMLMKFHPRAVVEGAAIAALTLDVKEVIIALNSGYQQCIENIKIAVDEILAEVPGLKHISFEVVRGPKPDLYITGEETALIEFLENRRGEPQLKPPFPFQSGYKGCPTIVQNVETLAWIPLLVADPELFRQQGHLKLVHIAGAVNAPGIYESKLGMTLQELLDMAGGLRQGANIQAIEVGGLAGGLLPPDHIDLPLEHDEMTKRGAMVGTGSVNFLDQDTNLVDIALRAMEFFRNESCGRCTPCRVGTTELLRIADILTHRTLEAGEQEWFANITHTMVNTSICGLGKGAPAVLVSLLRYWKVENGQALLLQKTIADKKTLMPEKNIHVKLIG